MTNEEIPTSSENKSVKLGGWTSLPAWQPLPASHLPLNPPMEPAVAQKLENKLLASKKKRGKLEIWTNNAKKILISWERYWELNSKLSSKRQSLVLLKKINMSEITIITQRKTANPSPFWKYFWQQPSCCGCGWQWLPLAADYSSDRNSPLMSTRSQIWWWGWGGWFDEDEDDEYFESMFFLV